MKAGLLEKIRGHGHWRVNLRPIVQLENRLSLQQCADLVSSHRVSLRGWDFPHVSNRQDEQGGSARVGEYFENWCDWFVHIEFWRMYRSGQFLSYKVVHDELEDEMGNLHESKILRVVNAVYTITEFVEFSKRLYSDKIFDGGASIAVTLKNNAGRELIAGRGRMPFSMPKISDAEEIHIQRNLDRQQLNGEHREVAIDMIVELFDHFGWNPDRTQILSDQDRFYRREF